MINKCLIKVDIYSINDFHRPNYFRLFPLILQNNLVIYNIFNKDAMVPIINKIHYYNKYFSNFFNRSDFIITDLVCSNLVTQLILIEVYKLKISYIKEGIDLYVESDNYN